MLPSDFLYFLSMMVMTTLVVLATHAARGNVTMAPLYAVAGIMTLLSWQLLQLGWWTSWRDFQINAAHLGMVPPLVMGMVLAYAMDGVRAARAYVLVVITTGLIAWSFAEFRDALAQHVPIPQAFSLSSRAYLAAFIALPIGALVSVWAYEGMCRWLLRPLALAGAVVFGSLGELLASSLLTYGFGPAWSTSTTSCRNISSSPRYRL